MELLFIWLICAVIAAIIGNKKGRGGAGFVLGFLFGPFGIIIILIIKGNKVKCFKCKELIDKEAIVCPYCRYDIPQNINKKNSEPFFSPLIIITIIIGVVVAVYIYNDLNTKKDNFQNKPTMNNRVTNDTYIDYKVLFLSGGINDYKVRMDILVSPKISNDDVIRLARQLHDKYVNNSFVNIDIFDSEVAWKNRENTKYPTDEYFKHYLVSITINKKTGYDNIKWMAKGRN